MSRVPLQLRLALETGQIVSSAQLVRRGWLQRVEAADLRPISSTVRTRSKQPRSLVTLDWYSPAHLDPRTPASVLVHQSCLTEMLLLNDVWRQGGTSRMVTGGLRGEAWPDAEILWRSREQPDAAVEADTGYDQNTKEEKLKSYVAQGFRSAIWVVTVHQQVQTWCDSVVEMVAAGQVDGLQRFRCMFTDIWSMHDPYTGRPRCHKPFWRELEWEGRTLVIDRRG